MRFKTCAMYLIGLLLENRRDSQIKFDIIRSLSEVLAALSRAPGSESVYHNLAGIIRKNYRYPGEAPFASVKDCLATLEHIHNQILSIKGIEAIRAYSEMSIFIVKVAKLSSEAKSSNNNGEDAKSHSTEPDINNSVWEIYKSTLTKVLGSRKLKFSPHLFADFVKSCPVLYPAFLQFTLDMVISGDFGGHSLVRAYMLLETILHGLSTRCCDEMSHVIKSAVQEVLTFTQNKIDLSRGGPEKGKHSTKKLMIRCIKLLKSKFKKDQT